MTRPARNRPGHTLEQPRRRKRQGQWWGQWGRWLLVLLLLAGVYLAWAYIQSQPDQNQPSPEQNTGVQVTGPANVLDGDTLEIQGVKVRLYGVDAPEADQTCRKGGKVYGCGREAALALADLLKNQAVTCQQRDQDRYGRVVAVCRVGQTDLGSWLVSRGYALAYREYSTDYVPQENAARAARRGLHAGTYVEPWNYRQGDTTPAAPPSMRRTPYASCAQARAAGRTPVLRGEPGYNPKLDGDQDGKMCE